MQARVTAIVVARSGASYLGRTLAGLARQTRQPDAVVAVDAGSTDSSAELLAAAGPTQLVTTKATSFGSAVDRALHVVPPQSADEWLWLLAHDNAPSPTALAQLLAAVEIAPSVAVAGPKLMRWEQPDVIDSYGETLTRFGASVSLVDGELDQAQHDTFDDVMGVGAAGMLVRRSVWVELGGFDPGLPSIDAALDFSIRARLAGHRVVVVPGAKVASIGGPEFFGRRSVPPRRRARIARAAQLHRRLVYAPAPAVPLHWLSLVPLAVVRALGQLLAKRPGFVGGEFAAAFSAAFSGGVGAARRNLRKHRAVGWAAVAPFRMPQRTLRERRAHLREATLAPRQGADQYEDRAGFLAHGGLGVVVIAAITGLVVFGPLLGAQALTGGGLLPLSATAGELWSHVGWGWRDVGTGVTGASDPFAYVVAIIGSIAFWSPSYGIVLVYLVAMPLAALGAWFAARRVTRRPWLPSIAAVLWAVAPPLLSSLSGGHLGAVLAHVLLPWLLLAALNAPRSWAASAGAALLMAAVAASAPVVIPALLVCWLAWLVARPTRALRIVGIPIPMIALFAPLIVQQVLRGNPLGVLAEPGVPVAGAERTPWQLALGSPAPGLDGWTQALARTTLPATAPAFVVAGLLVVLGALALGALFLPGSPRAIPALGVALLGYGTAVAAGHLQVALAGASAADIWPGAALSLFWLGLVAAAMVALDALGRAAIPLAALAVATLVILAVPLLGSFALKSAAIASSTGRVLPAVVEAESKDHPLVGTLVLSPVGDSLLSQLQRGDGERLDDQSTLVSTTTSSTSADAGLRTLAGNLASQSGLDFRSALGRYGIGFVLLQAPGAETDAKAVRQRAADALDANAALSHVTNTDGYSLWRVVQPDYAGATSGPANTGTALGRSILIGQGVVFGLTLLLGIPTSRRRRRVAPSGASDPADTFEDVDDD